MSIKAHHSEGHSGQLVKAKRLELGLTQAQVANAIGVQTKTVLLAETRRSWRGMRIGVCFDLCRFLGLELAAVYAEAGAHWRDRMDEDACAFHNRQCDREKAA